MNDFLQLTGWIIFIFACLYCIRFIERWMNDDDKKDKK